MVKHRASLNILVHLKSDQLVCRVLLDSENCQEEFFFVFVLENFPQI